MKHPFLLVLFFMVLGIHASQAQIREIPQVVKDSFAAKYPGAENPEYFDNLVHVQVRFEQNGEKKLATYTNKGVWKETENPFQFDQLSADVKDGFAKSKYSGDEWKVVDTKVVHRPGKKELYRIKVEKNELQKKYLFFNEGGKLESESLTL